MSSNRIAIFGCKSTTRFILDTIHAIQPVSLVVTIDTVLGVKNKVADYEDLKDYCSKLGITCYQAKTYALTDGQDQEFLAEQKLDAAFVMGWQRLVPAAILSNIKNGVYGMHGSSLDLPLGRGRSPMNWSIIEGRKAFYTNLFKYDPGVDSGDVVDTFKFQITERDTAETMHFKNTLAMKFLIGKNLQNILNGQVQTNKQDDTVVPTYYPKRTPADGLINWGWDVYIIERFVRAVTKPFDGAFAFIGQQKITIWNSQVLDVHDYGYGDLKPGTIATVFPNGKFLLKCLGGLLLVNEYEFEGAIQSGNQLTYGNAVLRKFPMNPEMGFDQTVDE